MDDDWPWQLPEGLRVRRAAPADGPLVLWLEEVSMKKHATALWGSWRPAARLQDLDLTDHRIIEQGDEAIGCLAMRRTESCLKLARLFIAPDHRNRGVGAHVLRAVVEQAIERGMPVRLSVLVTNPAIGFYLREGFSVERETVERRELVRYSDDQADR